MIGSKNMPAASWNDGKDRFHTPLDYWYGRGPLWQVYWVYGVLLSSIGAAGVLYLVTGGYVGPAGAIALIAIGFAYTAWVLVSVWHCAFNMGPSPFGIERDALGWLARVLTIGWALTVLGLSLPVIQIAFGG
jgi:hypothetical protein